MLLMLIGMGGGSLSKELYDWFGYTPSTATASAFVQQRNKIRSKAVEMIFNDFVSSAMPTMTFRGYRLLQSMDQIYVYHPIQPMIFL